MSLKMFCSEDREGSQEEVQNGTKWNVGDSATKIEQAKIVNTK